LGGSIASEKLMRAMLVRPILLDALEAPLMERLEFNVLFQSFVDVGVDGSIGTIQAFQESRPASEGDILAGEMLACLSPLSLAAHDP
jgi:hypothetical protein